MARPPERTVRLPQRAVAELERVPELLERFEAHAGQPPILGSLCWADRRLGILGQRPSATASMKLAVALEHADNVRRLILEGKTLPAWAHLTLLRPVFEASAQARWLLDSTVTPGQRVGRAVGAALEGLGERDKAEGDLLALGWTPSEKFVSVSERKNEITRQAAAEAAIEVKPMLDTVSLLGKYSLVTGRSDSIWWRYASGVLHTQVWATLEGDIERLTGEASWGQRHEANVHVATQVIVTAIQHLDAGVMAYVRYVEPEGGEAE